MKPMSSYGSVFEHWNEYMFMIGFAFVAIAVLIFLYYEFRVLQIKDLKQKYDFVNLKEVKFFWYAVIMLIVAGFFFANTAFTHKIMGHDKLWFYVRVFITVSLTIIAYFIFSSIVRIYYPKRLDTRLQKIRNKPRRSPDGNPMRKLSEAEEDHHLEADQVAEESSDVHSVDYDVWIDEKTGYKKIEKYMAYQQAEECSECGYFTMRIHNEEVMNKPTQFETGLLHKHFRCTYCNHRELRETVLAKLADNV
jgi:hypothetical protein